MDAKHDHMKTFTEVCELTPRYRKTFGKIETNCIVDKGHLQLQKNYVLSLKMTEFDAYDLLCKLFFCSKKGQLIDLESQIRLLKNLHFNFICNSKRFKVWLERDNCDVIGTRRTATLLENCDIYSQPNYLLISNI